MRLPVNTDREERMAAAAAVDSGSKTVSDETGMKKRICTDGVEDTQTED